MTSPTDTGGAPREDFLSADRRTMVIAVAAMLGLVAVGVLSSALFATPTCEVLVPRPMSPVPVAAEDPSAITAGLSPSAAQSFEEGLGAFEAEFGAVSGVASAAGAERLGAVGDGVALLGDSAVLLAGDGASVEVAATFEDATVRGSGDVVYALALENELTGQVDGFQPLDTDLDTLTCVETATVGTPLAFHLSASDGELLLLRTEEDGGEPQLQLRDPVRGIVWEADVELGQAPAGVLGERTSAALGERVVVGRRASAGDSEPALFALSREDGEVVWQSGADELDDVFDAGGERYLDVVAVRDDVALVLVTDDDDRDDADDRDHADGGREVLTVSLTDGRLVGREPAPDDAGLLGLRRGDVGRAALEAAAGIEELDILDVVARQGAVSVLLEVAGERVAVTFTR